MAENGDLHSSGSKLLMPVFVFFRDARLVFKMDSIGLEIIRIALPAALALAADPIASLIDTAFIGHLGPVEIAAVGVSIAIFNQASRITIFPLVNITTSFVAEEDTIGRIKNNNVEEESVKGGGGDDDDCEKGKAKTKDSTGMNVTVAVDDLKKGKAKTNDSTGMNVTVNPEDAAVDGLEKGKAKTNDSTGMNVTVNPEDAAVDGLEKGKAKTNDSTGMNVTVNPEDVAIDGLEKGKAKTNDSTGMNATVNPEDASLDDLEKGSTKITNSSEDAEAEAEKDCNAATCNKSPSRGDDSSVSRKTKKKIKQKRNIPSASTALIIGSFLGIVQTIFLAFGAKILLNIMGVKSDSPMMSPAKKYLTLRALGAPAVLLSLATQGVFRGFKDTKTPLYATVAGDLANIILDPIFIFVCRLGVSGAAIAHVLSQYLILVILLLRLIKEVHLLPPSFKDLQFSRFLKNGFWLLGRVIAATICVTLAASRAARLGPTPMAAFQVCLQIWLTSSLLADGLAVAGQAILAGAFAEKDYKRATLAATRVLQMGFVLGLGLALVVGLGLYFGSGVFSKDVNVIHLINIGLPFVAATQPINSIAFVFDGVNFGASDFVYSAYSMVAVAVVSITFIFVLSISNGFVGIWVALTIFMGLRTFAGLWRMGTGTGPWRFLRGAK